MKTALIFGITGQDGSYLARLLLEKKYIVHVHDERVASNFLVEPMCDAASGVLSSEIEISLSLAWLHNLI